MKETTVKLYWWRPSNFEGNFGDELGAPIIQKISGQQVVWSPLNECSHLAVGSILDYPWTKQLIHHNLNLTVLGTGLMAPTLLTPCTDSIKFVAVRGWLTYSILKSQGHHVNRNVGDIGLLASSLIATGQEKKFKLGIIPHHSNFDIYQKLLTLKHGAILIDLRSKNYISVLNTISSCNMIISESLHGLIVADSLNIPNVWLRNAPLHKGDDFKFMDYFSTIGRCFNSFVRLQDLNDLKMINSVSHKNWRSVEHLKSHVIQWLQNHFLSSNFDIK